MRGIARGGILKEKSTVAKMRAGKWLIPNISKHRTLQGRAIPGKVGSMEETRQIVDFHLLTHN